MMISGETATCLYNYPHENQLLPRVLPGTMLTLDEQCKRDRGTNACFVSQTYPSFLLQSDHYFNQKEGEKNEKDLDNEFLIS
jgi:hypothetical protein